MLMPYYFLIYHSIKPPHLYSSYTVTLTENYYRLEDLLCSLILNLGIICLASTQPYIPVILFFLLVSLRKNGQYPDISE